MFKFLYGFVLFSLEHIPRSRIAKLYSSYTAVSLSFSGASQKLYHRAVLSSPHILNLLKKYHTVFPKWLYDFTSRLFVRFTLSGFN
jgi:hypothetical protein